MQCVREVSWIDRHLYQMRAVCAVISLALPAAVGAVAISQSYQAAQTLTVGTLVQVTKANTVAPADSNHLAALVGVVTTTAGSTVAVIGTNENVQVATSGTTTAIVSDLGGVIKAGDSITASPVQGVGMKATEATRVIGVAQADATPTGESVDVKTKAGKVHQARLAQVPLAVQATYFVPQNDKSPLPNFLQAFANTIAGKPVAAVRVLVSATLVLLGLGIVTVMLSAAIRSTLAAIGRNPLATSSIYRGFWQIVGISLVIMVAALGGSYQVLVQ